MNFRFDPDRGLIIVRALVVGPSGTTNLRLALDTGATTTVINPAALTWIGYDLALVTDRVEMTTGSGVEYAARIVVSKMTSLGQTCEQLPVLAHTLPASAGVDGLLGLDFFRDMTLTIDLSRGQISLK